MALLGHRSELPELPELDNLFAPEGAILQAQALAAEAFGAGQTWFLANGSTAGVLAAVMACVQSWQRAQRTGDNVRLLAELDRLTQEEVRQKW